MRAGLRVESLEEFPSGDDEAYRLGDRLDLARRLPGSYLLIARKE